jgi:hypothetical protein
MDWPSTRKRLLRTSWNPASPQVPAIFCAAAEEDCALLRPHCDRPAI